MKRLADSTGSFFQILPSLGSITAIVIGTSGLIGWAFHIDFLKSITPESIAMKPNAALNFVFAGLSLFFLRKQPGYTKKYYYGFAHFCSLWVVIISSMTIVEYLAHVDFGIDQILHPETVGAVGTLYPGRMTLLVALNFLFTGLTLLFLNLRFSGNQYIQIFPIASILISLFELLGYQYGIKPMYGLYYNQMPAHSAVAFIFLSLGILASRLERGIAKIIVSQSLSGIMVRRLLLGAVIIPSFVGWLFFQAINLKLIDYMLAFTFFGITGIAILLVVVFWNARTLNRLDIKRQEAEQAQRQSELKYRTLISKMGDGLVQTDFNETIEFVNEQFCKLLGYTEADLLGKNAKILFPEEDLDKIAKKTALRLKRIADRYETRMVKKSGEKIWVNVSGAPVISHDEIVVGSVAIVTDITENKRVQLLNEALYKISQAADYASGLDDLFGNVHQVIQEVMPANNFYISLYDEENNLMSFPYFVDEVDKPEPPRKPGHGLTEYVLRIGKSVLCDDKLTEELMTRGEADIVGVPSSIWLGVPLIVDNKTIGVMVVQHYSDPNAYGEQEKQMLEYVSSQVAKVIAQKKAEVELTESEKRFRNLYNNVPVGIYRTTPDGNVINANPALLKMLGFERLEELAKRNLGKEGLEDSSLRLRFKNIIEKEGSVQGLESVWAKSDGTAIHVLENAIVVRDENRKIVYYEGMVEDITKRKLLEAERERVILELKNALAEVQTLSGLMPICANCKKIRDDKGYWNQIESYFESRASVQFSHGICPDCMKKLYPDYYAKLHSENT